MFRAGKLHKQGVVDGYTRPDGAGQNSLPQCPERDGVDAGPSCPVQPFRPLLGWNEARANRHPYHIGQLRLPERRSHRLRHCAPELTCLVVDDGCSPATGSDPALYLLGRWPTGLRLPGSLNLLQNRAALGDIPVEQFTNLLLHRAPIPSRQRFQRPHHARPHISDSPSCHSY